MQMAALMTTPRLERGPAATPTVRLVPSRPVARRGARPSAATFWRRRLVAGAVGLAVLVMAGKAGAALGGSPLAAPERAPATTRHVVQPGDSLWSIAERVERGGDPRPVVDALVAARGHEPLIPGEVVVWRR
jgi:nucleoid-associated protein YgaU